MKTRRLIQTTQLVSFFGLSAMLSIAAADSPVAHQSKTQNIPGVIGPSTPLSTGTPKQPPPKILHCAQDCDACTREGLRCTSSLECMKKYPANPILCLVPQR